MITVVFVKISDPPYDRDARCLSLIAHLTQATALPAFSTDI